MTDVTGKQFGSWTVLSIDPGGKRAGCRCACGRLQAVSVEALISGASTPCGCERLTAEPSDALRAEAAQRRRRRERNWPPGERS
jgi:hypothetical protein